MCSSYVNEQFLPDLMLENEFSQADSLIGIADSIKQVHLDVIKHIKQPHYLFLF